MIKLTLGAMTIVLCTLLIVNVASAATVSTDKDKYNVGEAISFVAETQGPAIFVIGTDPTFENVLAYAEGKDEILAETTALNVDFLRWTAKITPFLNKFSETEQTADLEFGDPPEEVIYHLAMPEGNSVSEASLKIEGYKLLDSYESVNEEFGSYNPIMSNVQGTVIQAADVYESEGLRAISSPLDDPKARVKFGGTVNDAPAGPGVIIKKFENVNYSGEDVRIEANIWNSAPGAPPIDNNPWSQERVVISTSNDAQNWTDCLDFSYNEDPMHTGSNHVSALCKQFAGQDMYVKVWADAGASYDFFEDLYAGVPEKEPTDVQMRFGFWGNKNQELVYPNNYQINFASDLNEHISKCPFPASRYNIPIKVLGDAGSVIRISNVRVVMANGELFSGSADINRAPVFDNPKVASINEGEIVRAPLASDLDGDHIMYSYSQLFDENGEWQTSFEDAGEYVVKVTASDGSLSDEKNFEITVKNVNRAPVLDKISDTTVTAGDTVKISAVASDPDKDAVSFTFPTPLNENGEWQTTDGDVGEYLVTVEASDGDLKDSKIAKIIVNSKSVQSSGGSRHSSDKNTYSGKNEQIVVKKSTPQAPPEQAPEPRPGSKTEQEKRAAPSAITGSAVDLSKTGFLASVVRTFMQMRIATISYLTWFLSLF